MLVSLQCIVVFVCEFHRIELLLDKDRETQRFLILDYSTDNLMMHPFKHVDLCREGRLNESSCCVLYLGHKLGLLLLVGVEFSAYFLKREELSHRDYELSGKFAKKGEKQPKWESRGKQQQRRQWNQQGKRHDCYLLTHIQSRRGEWEN